MAEDLEETKIFLEKIQENELYKKSMSIHKKFQMYQFSDPLTGELVNGQQIRREDLNGNPIEDSAYDEFTSRLVIYNFKNGVIHSENGEPAIQYAGHWEIWENGLISKVVDHNIEEIWSNGVPLSIKTL